ncbi:MAG: hypothetical protein MN733_12855 [Nitrososphaera sp.]|nr:hypothetical protein [Nitrososphaera sp.]
MILEPSTVDSGSRMTEYSLHTLTEKLVRHAYQNLRPNHCRVEDYCITLRARLWCAGKCISLLKEVLDSSRDLPDEELDICVLKETESCVFFLTSGLDALAHVVNLWCMLGIQEESAQQGSREAVSIGTVKDSLMRSETWRRTSLQGYFEEQWAKSWFVELRALRNRVTHRRVLEVVVQMDGNGHRGVFIKTDSSLPATLQESMRSDLLGYFKRLGEQVLSFHYGVLNELLKTARIV